MYRFKGATDVTDSYADLSFRHAGEWLHFGQELDDLNVAGTENMAITFVSMGDEVCGPSIGFSAVPPGMHIATGPAHAHASDNFRISLLGELTMGKDRYGPGAFRFQEGWRTYPNDNNSCGPDGGWEIVMMADRRGTRGRIAGAEDEVDDVLKAAAQSIAQMFGINGDIMSDDPKDGSGPSALATTLGPTTNSGKLNGSFAEADAWAEIGAGTRAAVSLLGEPTRGPVLVLSVSEPYRLVAPRCRFDTELLRMVVAGSCDVDGKVYEKGDTRVQRAGTWCGPVAAGPDGLQEVLVIGDRRHAEPTVEGGTWAYSSVVRELVAQLAARPAAEPATS